MGRYNLRRYAWALFAGFLILCLILIRLFQSGAFLGPQSPLTDVVVSEICARNNCVATGEGIHDYIELYNPTDRPISLGGLGISDGSSSPRGTVPTGVRLAPGAVKVIPLGTGGFDFGLKAGEVLTLFDRNGSVFFTYDLEGVAKNTVLERAGDGYVLTDSPSPGYPNDAEGKAAYEAFLKADLGIGLNELCQDSLSLTDGGDWIEIANSGTSSVSFPDLYLSDERNNLFKIRIPAGSLKPGEVLLADLGDRSRGKTFGLNGGETVWLSLEDGRICDSLKVLDAMPDVSQGREGLLECPTPGYPNTEEGRKEYLSSRSWDLVISEAMSWNRSYLLGPYGTPHDWFEIYNAGSEAADLSLYAVSKNGDGVRHPIGEGMLAPGGTVVVFADRDTVRILQGYAVVEFGISSSGCSLVLWKGDEAVDSINLPALQADTSYGRDGDMEFAVFATPTPEAHVMN